MNEIEVLQFPIGQFKSQEQYSHAEIQNAIKKLKEFPSKLERLIQTFTEQQLNKTYRPGAWNARQLVNHLGDVYINAYMRTKWLLTEKNPTIKPYDQDKCAGLPDSNFHELEVSLLIIDNLIKRWTFLLEEIPEDAYLKTLYHPEYNEKSTLAQLIAMYTWHGYHHLAHLKIIKGATL